MNLPVVIRRSAVVLVALQSLIVACRLDAQNRPDPWKLADGILARIVPPVFPAKDFNVDGFGARGDGSTDCSGAFAQAIKACSAQGGGRVVVPAGVYLTGPIHLLSNVNLHLDSGAVIRFDRDPKKYLPPVFTRWEGIELMNYSPFIYAFEQDNIAVTGSGTLDGQADNDHWWSWKGVREFDWHEGMPSQNAGRARLVEMGERGVPVAERVFGDGYYLRPNFIQPYRCRNVLIDGVTIINSPMWEVHPVLCENVTIANLHIDTHGPNNDGVDPESCRDVLIRECFFNTGDDCIAIKSGRNNDGRRLHTPSENIVIQRCRFEDGHGGVTIGSEISGGARNIFAEDCEAESPILYNALRIKSNAVRGGVVENINVRGFTVRRVGRAAIDVDLFYEEGRNGSFLPTIRDIAVEGMTVRQCNAAFNLVGYDDAPIVNVTLKDCVFDNAPKGYTVKHVTGFTTMNTTVNGARVEQ